MGSDPAMINRRRIEVNEMEAGGYSVREIADELLRKHLAGGKLPYFSWMDGRKFLKEDALTYEVKRERAYATIRQDLFWTRADDGGDNAIDLEAIAHERYVFLRRLRRLLRKVDGALFSAMPTDAKAIAQLAKSAIEISVRIARLGGIESDKPIEIKLPESFIVTIDQAGVVKMNKETPKKGEA